MKIGPRTSRNVGGLLVEDVRPEEVRRHQVGRELDPRELQPERRREGPGEQRLRDARNALDQRVPARHVAGEQRLDRRRLADDRLLHRLGHPRRGGRGRADPRRRFGAHVRSSLPCGRRAMPLRDAEKLRVPRVDRGLPRLGADSHPRIPGLGILDQAPRRLGASGRGRRWKAPRPEQERRSSSSRGPAARARPARRRARAPRRRGRRAGASCTTRRSRLGALPGRGRGVRRGEPVGVLVERDRRPEGVAQRLEQVRVALATDAGVRERVGGKRNDAAAAPRVGNDDGGRRRRSR